MCGLEPVCLLVWFVMFFVDIMGCRLSITQSVPTSVHSAAPVSADVPAMRRAWSGYHGRFPWQRQLSATASISGGEREECRWRRGLEGAGGEAEVLMEEEDREEKR